MTLIPLLRSNLGACHFENSPLSWFKLRRYALTWPQAFVADFLMVGCLELLHFRRVPITAAIKWGFLQNLAYFSRLSKSVNQPSLGR
jgi:uncharacterized protein YybS (DUF2232 family)